VLAGLTATSDFQLHPWGNGIELTKLSRGAIFWNHGVLKFQIYNLRITVSLIQYHGSVGVAIFR
ncbi:MAG: hypothetical protein M3Q76_10410, partial [Acidobacteriota bacterium]|nr:hypothetical protein [Acidobacteriota bacterium]